MTSAKDINWASMFKPAAVVSFLLVVGSLVMFFTKGLNYGVDFRGGVEIQVKFSEQVELGNLRELMNKNKIPLSQLQSIGEESANEFLLKLEGTKGDLNEVSSNVNSVLKSTFGEGKFEILKNDIVGPKAGAALRNSAFKSLAWAILAIMIYLALRFDYKFAPGAIVALIHDVTILVGIFILTQKEFSLQIVAALLAIIGYSVNDTVVIYDRVREIESLHPNLSTIQTINRALNETLSRTLITSITVLGVSVMMLVLGGPVIHDFFFAITIGVILGVYSTIFVAIPVTAVYEKFSPKAS